MKQHSKRFEILDGLRGAAALYVVIHHARLLCLESYNTGYSLHPERYSILDKIALILMSFFRFGSEAVTLFFLLSGLVIHYKHAHSVMELNDKYRFETLKYFRNRIYRIYPPLIFSILMMLGIGYLSKWIYNVSFPENLSFKTIIGNLSFITIPYFEVVGNNYPLWSLRVEWWIYVIYPLFFYVNRKWCFQSYFIVIFIAIALFIVNLNHAYFWVDTLLFFPTWCLGALVADVLSNRIGYRKEFNWLIFLIPIGLYLGGVLSNNYLSDFLFGVSLFPFFIFILEKNSGRLNTIVTKFISFFKIFCPFSYTLYIIHFPIQAFLSEYYKRSHNQHLPQKLSLAIFSIIISLIVAFVAHFITERKFKKVK